MKKRRVISHLYLRSGVFGFIASLLLIFSFTCAAVAAEVTLAWDADSGNNLAGYKLYYKLDTGGAPYTGTGADQGNSPITINLSALADPSSPSYTVTGLQEGRTYYFVLTAFSTDGLESGYSNEVSLTTKVTSTTSTSSSTSTGTSSTGTGTSSTSTGTGSTITDTGTTTTSGSSDTQTSTGSTASVTDTSGTADSSGTQTDSNSAPAQPVAAASTVPTSGVGPADLSLGAFSDPDAGDTLAKTQWQVFRSEDDVCVLDVTSTTHLTELQVPDIILDENSTYYWQARFYDNHGAASPWSEAADFTTGSSSVTDANGNGIPDDQEVNSSVDLNGDGVPDADQEVMKSVMLPTIDEPEGLSIANSSTATALPVMEAVDTANLDLTTKDKTQLADMPYGLINFKMTVAKAGDAATVTVYFPEAVPADAKWMKYDPIGDTWIDYSGYTQISSDGKSMQIELVDGGYGDDDGVANGIIVDPAGLAYTAADTSSSTSASTASDTTTTTSVTSSGSSATSKGGGGGCFITGAISAGSPISSAAALGILFLFIGVSAILARPRRGRQAAAASEMGRDIPKRRQ